ncbi:hypothetical protein O9993_20870 [Vibrio lentus]|nr:hypothetical protein [Vibrio lentus]
MSTCRSYGLYQTRVDVPRRTIYDDEGREKMGADHLRRVIGCFTQVRRAGTTHKLLT